MARKIITWNGEVCFRCGFMINPRHGVLHHPVDGKWVGIHNPCLQDLEAEQKAARINKGQQTLFGEEGA